MRNYSQLFTVAASLIATSTLAGCSMIPGLATTFGGGRDADAPSAGGADGKYTAGGVSYDGELQDAHEQVAFMLKRREAASNVPVEVTATRPDWCEGTAFEEVRSQNGAMNSAIRRDGFGASNLRSLAELACTLPDSKHQQALTAIWRGGYLAFYGITEAEDHQHLVARVNGSVGKDQRAACSDLTAPHRTTPHKQALASLLGCDDSNYDLTALDRDTTNSPLVASVLLRQFGGGTRSSDNGFGNQIMYAAEAKRFDLNKLAPALAAEGVGAALIESTYLDLLWTARIVHAEQKSSEAKTRVRDYPELAAIGKAAEAAYVAWDKFAKANAKPLAAIRKAQQAVAGGVTSEIASCRPAMQELISTLMRGAKPDTVDEVQAVFATPLGMQAAEAMSSCATAEGDRAIALVATTRAIHRKQRRHVGARVAAAWAMADAMELLGKEKKALAQMAGIVDLEIKAPTLDQPESKTLSDVVDSVTTEGDVVTVTFEQSTTRERDQICVDTQQIASIGDNGVVYYKQACRAGGMVAIHHGNEPLRIAKSMAAGIKAGRMVDFATDVFSGAGSAKLNAAPDIVYADSKGKRPVAVLGALIP